ncbi:ABC transporter permease [Actinomadura sp. 9N407]|uniref:ABC transporter permease n=1 Tax=Actinomadura sp. 9N407 TaxID=3375154 RepID=UPI0037B5F5C8
MTTLSFAARDSVTMTRRNLRHAQRYPGMTIATMGTPIIMLLLFVGVFGGALGAGISGGGDYIDYIAPGIILMGVTSGCMVTSVSVCTDMTEGIVARFRTMPISRTSLLTGHVVGSIIQTMVSTALVAAVAVLMGFRPDASAVEWLVAFALLSLLSLALTWLAVGLGLMAKTPEGASNSPILLQFLPFIGSAVVPPESMPAGVRWFAEYQPFTSLNETIRGLLMGTPIGSHAVISLAWCAVIGVGGYLWSKRLFKREMA